MLKIKSSSKAVAAPANKPAAATKPAKPVSSVRAFTEKDAEAVKLEIKTACAAVVNNGIRQSVDIAKEELTAFVEKQLTVGLEKRIVHGIETYFKQRYELVRVPYDVRWPVLTALMDEGWRVMEVISPAMAKVSEHLKAGFVMQRLKGAAPSAAMKAALAGANEVVLPNGPVDPPAAPAKKGLKIGGKGKPIDVESTVVPAKSSANRPKLSIGKKVVK